jgi:hypothetical protein
VTTLALILAVIALVLAGYAIYLSYKLPPRIAEIVEGKERLGVDERTVTKKDTEDPA